MLVQTLNSPDVKDFIAKGAYEASPGTPAELMTEMHVAYDKWGQMVKAIGFEKQ
jgi:tripartite-type tricarboxylate transporter receptor subunit TctC